MVIGYRKPFSFSLDQSFGLDEEGVLCVIIEFGVFM